MAIQGTQMRAMQERLTALEGVTEQRS